LVSANGGAPVLIRHYTDPTCPFAFSAERQRLRLEWLYGEQLDWELHMVVLADERPGEAFPPERIASTRRELQLRYGMPIDWRPVEANASLPACRAVVATRLHAPDREAALLRRLRVLQFSALDIDDPAVIEPPVDWPTASRVDLPGYRPVEAYEAALANIAPELVRRPDPESVEEVLAWAGMPVATAEVAAVCDRDVADVRADLARAGTFLPVGGDGYWTAASD